MNLPAPTSFLEDMVRPYGSGPGPAYTGRYYKHSRGRRATAFTFRTLFRTIRTGYKHRSKLWPSFVGLGMLALALAFRELKDGWKTVLVLAVIVGIALGLKQYRAFRAAEAWAKQSLIVSWGWWTACAWWVTEAAAIGPFAASMGGLLVLGALVSQAWWLVHRYNLDTGNAVEVAIEERAERVIDHRVEAWVTNIACDGGALPASLLIGMTDLAPDDESEEDDVHINLGWEALIQLPVDDAQNSESAVAATRRIAKVYRVPATQVVVEPSLDGMEDNARLLVLTRNPLMKPRTFKGPTLDVESGAFELGIHADGARALWRLWKPRSGVCHGMVAGTTDAGKSGILMNLCAEIRHSGCANLLLGDPEHGESVKDWQLGAHCFAGTVPRIRRMLQGAERIMIARKKRRSREEWVDENGITHRGRGFFEPTPEEPAIYVVIDEAPDVLADPECRRIIAQIGKKGRKHGVAVIIFVQIPSLSELGGDLAVRSMLSSTNIVILRTSDSLSAQMGVPMKLPIDPANLPESFPNGSTTAGLGYLAKAGGRVSAMRAAYQDNPWLWANGGQPAAIRADDYAAMADEHGNMFDQWRELMDLDEDDEEGETVQRSTGGYVPSVSADTKTRILEFLQERGEPVRLGVIATELGLNKPATSNALAGMAKKGLVSSAGNGTWSAEARELATA